jgi:hypothetical protein
VPLLLMLCCCLPLHNQASKLLRCSACRRPFYCSCVGHGGVTAAAPLAFPCDGMGCCSDVILNNVTVSELTRTHVRFCFHPCTAMRINCNVYVCREPSSMRMACQCLGAKAPLQHLG